MFSVLNPNPELEKLRNEVLKESDLNNHEILNIQNKASVIHAAYLFQIEARDLLQKLCLLLSSTASGKSYGDWQKFAFYLNLTNEQIKCIDFDFKGLQDPTYYVLLAYVQSDNASVDKVITALKKIDRLDIIHRIHDDLIEFFNKILKNETHLKKGIHIPVIIPKAPLVLKPLIGVGNKPIEHEIISTASVNQDNLSKNKSFAYGSTVLLTFDENHTDLAKEITEIFRNKQSKIGVVVLQEHEKSIYTHGEQFIDDCFNQVKYIVPILTEDYINKINFSNSSLSETSTLDSKYLRYIYCLFRNEYLKNDCSNSRVRCLVPDNQVNKIMSMDLHPTLHAWFRISDIDLFSDNILLQNF